MDGLLSMLCTDTDVGQVALSASDMVLQLTSDQQDLTEQCTIPDREHRQRDLDVDVCRY